MRLVPSPMRPGRAARRVGGRRGYHRLLRSDLTGQVLDVRRHDTLARELAAGT